MTSKTEVCAVCECPDNDHYDWCTPQARASEHSPSKEKVLEQRARDSGSLLERLQDSRRRIGKMCSERRGPRMTIPVEWSDDDFYICLALEDAIAALQPDEPTTAQLDEHDAGIIKDLEAMAANQLAGFWPQALAIGALRLIRQTASSSPSPDPLAVSHLRGLVYHWNEFGPVMCLEEKMHYAHEWLKRHDESIALTKESTQRPPYCTHSFISNICPQCELKRLEFAPPADKCFEDCGDHCQCEKHPPQYCKGCSNTADQCTCTAGETSNAPRIFTSGLTLTEEDKKAILGDQ